MAKVAMLPYENNGFKNKDICSRMDAHKNVEILPDIALADVKRRVKELSTPQQKITINDLIMTVLSKTLHDYLREHTNDKTTKSVNMACTFSLREAPESVGEFTFENDFSIILVPMKLVDSLE